MMFSEDTRPITEPKQRDCPARGIPCMNEGQHHSLLLTIQLMFLIFMIGEGHPLLGGLLVLLVLRRFPKLRSSDRSWAMTRDLWVQLDYFGRIYNSILSSWSTTTRLYFIVRYHVKKNFEEFKMYHTPLNIAIYSVMLSFQLVSLPF